VRGSKKRGIETLQRAAREARFAQDDAKVILIAVLKAERRYSEALAFARELSQKYTRNYLFKLEVADALISQAEVDRQTNKQTAAEHEREAFSIFDALLADEKAARNSSNRAFDLVHFQYGEALFASGQFARAVKEFQSAAKVTGAEQGLATRAHLRAAQSLDLTGQRSDALAEYRNVLSRPNVFDAHEEAQRGLREPYKAKG
jgi:tetratricopeptide (TPR) repeat protein